MIKLENVKLVITDMDGTLLHSDYSLNPEFFEIYEQLKKLNITFCVASGRQYESLKQIFNSIQDEIYFVAENGGYVVYQDQPLITKELTQDAIQKVLNICKDLPNTEVLLCGIKSAYVENSAPEFAEHIIPYYPKNKVVPDLTAKIEDQIIKIAIYNSDDTEKNVLPSVKDLEKKYQVKISGKHWLDISPQASNKGEAIKKIQDILSVSKEETLVFGDYLNDLEMLEQAYFSYAMENSHPYVKEIARYQTDSNDNDGVLKIMKKIISQKK